MILIGVIYGAFHGTLPEITTAALNSAKEAVTLCITMTGIMSFWVGLMKIAENGGIIAGASRKLKPVLRFLFPHIPEGHSANKYIATNMIANVFGLGWAATPAGLKAMEALAELEEEKGTPGYLSAKAYRDGDVGESDRYGRKNLIEGLIAEDRKEKKQERIASNEMCTFLIINISSLQLIPVNIIAYRQQYGSVNPTEIVGPAIVATAVSTGVAVVFCKLKDRGRRK